MRIISPVTAELTDSELITIQRALERWSGMDDELAQLIGAVAETGSTFTLATMPDAETTAECPDPVAGITVDADSRRLALVCSWHLGHNGSDRAIPLADIIDAIDERDCG